MYALSLFLNCRAVQIDTISSLGTIMETVTRKEVLIQYTSYSLILYFCKFHIDPIYWIIIFILPPSFPPYCLPLLTSSRSWRRCTSSLRSSWTGTSTGWITKCSWRCCTRWQRSGPTLTPSSEMSVRMQAQQVVLLGLEPNKALVCTCV